MLGCETLRELKKQARRRGVPADTIDAVDDADDAKQAAVELLVQHTPELIQSGALVRYMHSETGETSMTVPGLEQLVPFLRRCGIRPDTDAELKTRANDAAAQVKRLKGEPVFAPPALPPPPSPPPSLETADQQVANSLGPGLKGLKRASSTQGALPKIQTIFNEIDQDASGIIDASELLAWSNRQGADPTFIAKLQSAIEITGKVSCRRQEQCQQRNSHAEP